MSEGWRERERMKGNLRDKRGDLTGSVLLPVKTFCSIVCVQYIRYVSARTVYA